MAHQRNIISNSRIQSHVRLLALLCLLLLLAACNTGEDGPRAVLPTLAQLPSPLPADAIAQLPITQATEAAPTAESVAETATASPTATHSATPTPQTFTPTVTPSATITETPSPTATEFPTEPPENRPLTSLLMEALEVTLLPNDFQIPAYEGLNVPIVTPVPAASGIIVIPPAGAPPQSQAPATSCVYLPAGGFGSIFSTNPDIARNIGCPVGSPPDVLSINAAYQPFQQGFMLWLGGEITVFYNASRSFQRYPDIWVEGVDPQNSGETAPAGLFAPVRGFNKVWANNPAVRSGLGWAVQAEQGAQATVQNFDRGRMLWIPLRNDVLVLISPDGLSGTWTSVTGRF